MGYSIGQVAEKTRLSTYTLRYYEKEGLLPFVKKSKSGLRVFSDNDLSWLSMIEGDSTLPQRLEMFKQQKIRVKEQIEMLEKNMERINRKIEIYEKAVEKGSLEKVIKSCK